MGGYQQCTCWSALLSAGVTLAPPSRGQYWRLTGLVWHAWVEVEVELKARGASSSELRPVTHSQSHVCGGQIGRLADRRLTGTCRQTDGQAECQTMCDGDGVDGDTACLLYRIGLVHMPGVSHGPDQGQGDLVAEMSRAAINRKTGLPADCPAVGLD